MIGQGEASMTALDVVLTTAPGREWMIARAAAWMTAPAAAWTTAPAVAWMIAPAAAWMIAPAAGSTPKTNSCLTPSDNLKMPRREIARGRRRRQRRVGKVQIGRAHV